jgi:hypothetical protein
MNSVCGNMGNGGYNLDTRTGEDTWVLRMGCALRDANGPLGVLEGLETYINGTIAGSNDENFL